MATHDSPSTPPPFPSEVPPPYQPSSSRDPLGTESSRPYTKPSHSASQDAIDLENVYLHIQDTGRDAEVDLFTQSAQAQPTATQHPDQDHMLNTSAWTFLYVLLPLGIWILACSIALWVPRKFCHPTPYAMVFYFALPLFPMSAYALGALPPEHQARGRMSKQVKRKCFCSLVVAILVATLLLLGWIVPCKVLSLGRRA